MRISAHHRNQGDRVVFWNPRKPTSIDQALFLEAPDLVYASLIFNTSRSLANYLLQARPDALIGGTGWAAPDTLEQKCGITTLTQDYSIYPAFQRSIGFAIRGCRLKCPFCVVPVKE